MRISSARMNPWAIWPTLLKLGRVVRTLVPSFVLVENTSLLYLPELTYAAARYLRTRYPKDFEQHVVFLLRLS